MSRALVVDPSRLMCSTLESLLESDGYTVSTYTTAKEALERLEKQFSFDMLFINLQMSDMDALTFVQNAFRLAPLGDNGQVSSFVPFLLTEVKDTNHFSDRQRTLFKTCCTSGLFARVFQKPVQRGSFLETVRDSVERAKQKLASHAEAETAVATE